MKKIRKHPSFIDTKSPLKQLLYYYDKIRYLFMYKD